MHFIQFFMKCHNDSFKFSENRFPSLTRKTVIIITIIIIALIRLLEMKKKPLLFRVQAMSGPDRSYIRSNEVSAPLLFTKIRLLKFVLSMAG